MRPQRQVLRRQRQRTALLTSHSPLIGLICSTRFAEIPSKCCLNESLHSLLVKRSNRYSALRSYIEDFRAQHYQYESHREIFMAAPSAATDTGIISLRELIDFISHVADAYPEILKDFPQQLIDMLMQHHLVLEPELREKLVGSLVLLKKKDLLDSATYVHPMFSWHLILGF